MSYSYHGIVNRFLSEKNVFSDMISGIIPEIVCPNPHIFQHIFPKNLPIFVLYTRHKNLWNFRKKNNFHRILDIHFFRGLKSRNQEDKNRRNNCWKKMRFYSIFHKFIGPCIFDSFHYIFDIFWSPNRNITNDRKFSYKFHFHHLFYYIWNIFFKKCNIILGTLPGICLMEFIVYFFLIFHHHLLQNNLKFHPNLHV